MSLLVENETTLLVANEGDGHLGMLELDASGDLVSARYLIDPQLLHLSALALDNFTGDTLFATNEGEDTAVLFPLGLIVFSGSQGLSGIHLPNNPDNPNDTQTSGDLDTAGSFATTLVSITALPVSLLLMEASIQTIAAVPTGVGQSMGPDDHPGQDQESGAEVPEESQQPGPVPTPTETSPPRKLAEYQGLDKALDEARRQIQEELTSKAGPEREAAGVSPYNPSIIESEAEDLMEPPRGPSSGAGDREDGGFLLIDKAVGLLMEEPRAVPPTIPRRTSSAPGVGQAKGRHRLVSSSPAILVPLVAVVVGAPYVRRTARCRSALRPG